MRLKKICKKIDFVEHIRDEIVLGNNVRLDAVNNYLKLIDNDGIYPLDDDLFAKTRAINPNSVKQWLGFQCDVLNFMDDYDATTPVTGVYFRMHDGQNEYWHDGDDWTVNTINWNTEEQICANILTFPVATKKIGAVLNLYTDDEYKTPIVKSVKFLYSSDIEHQDDYLYRTIVRQLNSQIRPLTDFALKLVSTSTTIDLSANPLKTPYEIIGIDSVFDDTDDPDHMIDLYQSYNPTTKIITLSSAIQSNSTAWIKIIHKPTISITTGLEYTELAKVPAIVLSDISLVNMVELSHAEFVLNKYTKTGTKIFPPKRRDIEISMIIITDSARDQTRIADEAKRFFDNNPVLTSWGLDEDFTLMLLDDYSTIGTVSSNGLQSGKLRFALKGALYYERDAVETHAVESFKITGDLNITI